MSDTDQLRNTNHQVLPDQGQHDLYGRRKSGRLNRPTTIEPRRHQQAQLSHYLTLTERTLT